MPLVKAQCTSCGATLKVDDVKEVAVCPYCGASYIVEKAINHYHVTNRIHAETVNIYNQTPDFEIRAGKLEKYMGAATEVVIPASVKIIGAGAFGDCIGLTRIVIPDSVTTIEHSAFSGCTGLIDVSLPDSVTAIAPYTFANCSALVRITIPDSVTSIEYYAFLGCASLTDIILPDSVTSIGARAFEGCTNLTAITIPDSVTSVGASPFLKCANLTEIRASETWKRKHWIIAPCLVKTYASFIKSLGISLTILGIFGFLLDCFVESFISPRYQPDFAGPIYSLMVCCIFGIVLLLLWYALTRDN